MRTLFLNLCTFLFLCFSGGAGTAKSPNALEYLNAGQYEKARVALAQETLNQPSSKQYKTLLEGMILQKQGDLPQASKVFTNLLIEDPTFEPARQNLVRIYVQLEEKQKALFHANYLQKKQLGFCFTRSHGAVRSKNWGQAPWHEFSVRALTFVKHKPRNREQNHYYWRASLSN